MDPPEQSGGSASLAVLTFTMPTDPLLHATPDLPGIGGTLKQRPEDFFVQELPLYDPSGEGEHVLFEVQKVGLGTFEAIERMSKAFNIKPREFGYAGMKDKHAVTRQLFSVRGATEEAVMTTPVAGLTPQWAARHGNKLKLGHLAGNRFAVKVRDVEPTSVVRVRPMLARLEAAGLPNYFGEQRFGRRDDNDRVGAALLRQDAAAVVSQLLGSPTASDEYEEAQARMAVEEGNYREALELWPRRGAEQRVLARLAESGDPAAAVAGIDKKMRRLYVSALQSRLFNRVVAERLTDGTLGTLKLGDLAWKHENGACFRVVDPAAEQPRADAFDISPSGPLFGRKMTEPTGKPAETEAVALAHYGLAPEDFRQSPDRPDGARRPLRVRPTDTTLAAGVDEFGPHVTVAFTLPPGSYATTVMREIMKVD